jgi:hypothetical protein
MIVFRPYNVIVPKYRIEDQLAGGLIRLRENFGNSDFQEDEYLIAIGLANATEVREVFEHLLKAGLRYDEQAGASDDFVVMAKEGIWWPAPWLVCNGEGCWFIADIEAPTEKTNQS